MAQFQVALNKFNNNINFLPGDDRHRLSVQDHVPRGQNGAIAALGYGGPGTVSLAHPLLHPRLDGGCCSL